MTNYTYGALSFEPYSEGKDSFVEQFDGFSSRLHINKNTGHLQFHPVASQDILDRYYNGSFTRSEEGPKPENEFTPQILDIVVALKGYLQTVGGMPETFTYHDIGCGFGAGVWGFQQHGIKATGNEANKTWVDAANPHCNYALSSEPLEKVLEGIGYKVDVFFSAHVLEHVPDPLAVMKTVAAHLSENGVFYITVPNNHCRRVQLQGRRTGLDYLTLDNTGNFPMHLNFFTAKSMAHLLRQAGLEPFQVETRPLDELPDTQAAQRDETRRQFYETNPQSALLGGELFMLAGKPGNTTAERAPNLDQQIEDALSNFRLGQKRLASQTRSHFLPFLGSLKNQGWISALLGGRR